MSDHAADAKTFADSLRRMADGIDRAINEAEEAAIMPMNDAGPMLARWLVDHIHSLGYEAGYAAGIEARKRAGVDNALYSHVPPQQQSLFDDDTPSSSEGATGIGGMMNGTENAIDNVPRGLAQGIPPPTRGLA